MYNQFYVYVLLINSIALNRGKFSEASPDNLDSNSSRHRRGKRHSRTITDPCYPVFRSDGLSVSQSLYEQHVASHCEELCDEDNNDGDNGNFQLKNLSNELTSIKFPANNISVTKDGTLQKKSDNIENNLTFERVL